LHATDLISFLDWWYLLQGKSRLLVELLCDTKIY